MYGIGKLWHWVNTWKQDFQNDYWVSILKYQFCRWLLVVVVVVVVRGGASGGAAGDGDNDALSLSMSL